ncbi:hypothetical protein H2248_007755 [Termitomyces sp. 'cryptogamus']|nr:hypothetical protein H2248_007755 [Termitomyces sp. 'cryptogamus']
MCIHVVYEIKVENTEVEHYRAVKQLGLGAYMHPVMIKQLERRSVLGFILLFDELTLVLYDQSGVTRSSINIERYPGIDGKIEKYVTIAIVSAICSAQICARPTVGYEVVKFDEKDNPQQLNHILQFYWITYAFKRYWRPVCADYLKLFPGLYPYIKAYGQVDSTFKLIRGWVAQRSKRPGTETDTDAERRAESRDVPEDAPVLHVDSKDVSPDQFCHSLELVPCFRDFIRDGHDKLILHHDINTGDLLIFQA